MIVDIFNFLFPVILFGPLLSGSGCSKALQIGSWVWVKVIIVRLSSNCYCLAFFCYTSLVLFVCFSSVLHSPSGTPCPLLFIPLPVSPLSRTLFTRRFSAAGHFYWSIYWLHVSRSEQVMVKSLRQLISDWVTCCQDWGACAVMLIISLYLCTTVWCEVAALRQ